MTHTDASPVRPRVSAAEPFVVGLAALVASTPARNPDLWRHLADGRAVLIGDFHGFSLTWLFDVGNALAWSLGGGAAVVAAKAVVVAVAALLMLRACRAGGAGGGVAATATALAVVTMAVRLPLQPPTYALLFLAVVVRLLHRPKSDGKFWPLAVTFLIWANTDRWFLTGLGVVALTWIGRALDGRPVGRRWPVAMLALAGICLLNPVHLSGFPKPPEAVGLASSFGAAYRAEVDHPAAVAYYPLLGLGLLSFLVNGRNWRWAWFLPWAGLAGLSIAQWRAVPLFAVLAGPVLAWNTAEVIARGGWANRRKWTAVRVAGGVLAVGLLIAAWVGWLGRPPYGMRQWAAEPPSAAASAADAVRRLTAAGAWPADTRTLHLSADTAAAFAWVAPDAPGGFDPKLVVEAFADGGLPDAQRLRAAEVTRVVAAINERSVTDALIDRLLDDPEHWPLLHLDGGWFVFGVGADLQRLALDRDRFGMTADDPAPEVGPRPDPSWRRAFTRRLPLRTAERDQAAALIRLSEADRKRAPYRHVQAWEAGQAAAAVGAAAAPGWPTAAGWRLTLVRPPLPDDARFGRLLFGMQQRFARDRGDTPAGALYAAVRSGRRAVAADPNDSAAYLALGRAYVRLIETTYERGWADRRGDLSVLRHSQAVFALRRAVESAPKSADARLALGRFYQTTGLLDLALDHLRAYRALAPKGGVSDAELDALAKAVSLAREAWAKETARGRVADRATAAADRGLGGAALALLLESDVAAFGQVGTKLELELLLQTGRPLDVLDWATPEVSQALGGATYYRLRAFASAAVGDYAAADAALGELADSLGPSGGLGRLVELVGGMVGVEVLAGASVGPPTVPGAVLQANGHSDFLARLGGLVGGHVARAEVTTLRGLLEVEAGNLTAARRTFADAAPDPLAADGLRMLGDR